MSNSRGAVCRAHALFSSLACCYRSMVRISSSIEYPTNSNFRNQRCYTSSSSSSLPSHVFSFWFESVDDVRVVVGRRRRLNQQRRTVATKASKWADTKSPYETLELERNADGEQIKVAYRRLAKFYHPDVYDGRGTLNEGETAEARFIKIQAAYELLIDEENRKKYDTDNRENPMKASEAWMEWLMKKRRAFDQRGDMAIAAWAEQQQLELNLRARRLARSKIDPEEERKILVKEKKAYTENFQNTLRRHTLVLRKRDLMRKKSEEDKKTIINRLLAAEGLELAKDDDDDDEEEV